MSSKAIKNKLIAAKKSQVLVAYVPVIHEGYRQFFAQFPEVNELWLIDRELAPKLPALRKDIRALAPAKIKSLLKVWGQFKKIELLTPSSISTLQKTTAQLIFPNEEISRLLAKKYFGHNRVLFAPSFLRWDKKSSLKKNELQGYSKISNKEFDQTMMAIAQQEADKSDDWWRQVGGVIFKDKTVLLKAHNQHTPTEYEAYFAGDPRANFYQGEYLKVSTAIHVEAFLIAQAAKLGIPLKGADLYVTTFPCPVCAKQVAYSGIKRVFFRDGYSLLDGETILKANDVELIQVK
ncbi:MAG: deaminase [Candidatus Paceibacterota bacterium]